MYSGAGYQAFNPGQYQQKIENLYANSQYLQNYSQRLTNEWSAAATYSNVLTSLGYQFGLDAAKATVQAGEQKAGVLLMAASHAGTTAADLRTAQLQQKSLDTSTGLGRVGAQMSSYAGSGLAISGSASLLIHETLDSNLRETKSNFLSLAAKENEARQQKINLLTESQQTIQTSRQQANTVLATSVANIMANQLRNIGG